MSEKAADLQVLPKSPTAKNAEPPDNSRLETDFETGTATVYVAVIGFLQLAVILWRLRCHDLSYQVSSLAALTDWIIAVAGVVLIQSFRAEAINMALKVLSEKTKKVHGEANRLSAEVVVACVAHSVIVSLLAIVVQVMAWTCLRMHSLRMVHDIMCLLICEAQFAGIIGITPRKTGKSSCTVVLSRLLLLALIAGRVSLWSYFYVDLPLDEERQAMASLFTWQYCALVILVLLCSLVYAWWQGCRQASRKEAAKKSHPKAGSTSSIHKSESQPDALSQSNEPKPTHHVAHTRKPSAAKSMFASRLASSIPPPMTCATLPTSTVASSAHRSTNSLGARQPSRVSCGMAVDLSKNPSGDASQVGPRSPRSLEGNCPSPNSETGPSIRLYWTYCVLAGVLNFICNVFFAYLAQVGLRSYIEYSDGVVCVSRPSITFICINAALYITCHAVRV